MDQSYEPERDRVVNTTSRWELTAFGDVLAVAEQIGTNKGRPYRSSTSIAPGSHCTARAGAHLHAAWFNLGAGVEPCRRGRER